MPMAKNTKNSLDPAMEQKLLAELTLLRDELCDSVRGRSISSGKQEKLGLFRIFDNVSIAQWRKISKRLDLAGWLTLPINRDVYPHLTTLQENLDRLAYESEHDGLTGLANRRSFERFLDIELERAHRAKTAMSLAIIDLDNFKHINDTYGHPAGDKVLTRLAEIMSTQKRRYDMAARIGGEEFALIVPGSGQVRTQTLLERILKIMRRETFTTDRGETFSTTFSAGVASFRGSSEMSVNELMSLADKALYQAKETGKARVKLAPLPQIENIAKQTLVQASEKKFLFTGKK